MGSVAKPFIHSLVSQQNYCCSTVGKRPDAGVAASASLMGGSFDSQLAFSHPRFASAFIPLRKDTRWLLLAMVLEAARAPRTPSLLVIQKTWWHLTSVIVQIHQILRLPRKGTLIIDPCHTWNAIYNARSNKCHCPNSSRAFFFQTAFTQAARFFMAAQS